MVKGNLMILIDPNINRRCGVSRAPVFLLYSRKQINRSLCLGNITENIATILVVDDDDMNLEILSFILSSTFCKVIKAQNGLEALKQLDGSLEIDVMLVDLEMPVMDGYEFIRHIKQNQNYRHIPIVVLTSNTDEVNQTLSMGANDFISKPYKRGHRF